MQTSYLKRKEKMKKTANLARLILVICLIGSGGAALSDDWNYFGTCGTDDVILAKGGKFYRSEQSCITCKSTWKYAGRYVQLSDKVIQASWSTNEGVEGRNYSETYTHKSLSGTKCRR
jgi:hypothetical protein